MRVIAFVYRCVCVCVCPFLLPCFDLYVFVCVCVWRGGCTQHTIIVGAGLVVHGLLRGLFLRSGEGRFICFAQH